MKTRLALGVLAVGSAIALSAALGLAPQEVKPAPAPAATPQSASAETFKIDPVHTSVIFKIQHMGVSNFYGRFNDASGSYSLDPANGNIDVVVKTASLDTNNKKRDSDVLGPNFFNGTEFPTITFKSNKISKAGDKLTAAGDLSFHGVTKPITVTLATVGPKQTRMGTRSGFETTFTIKRSDYGFAQAGQDGLGDEVQLTISVEGTQGQ